MRNSSQSAQPIQSLRSVCLSIFSILLLVAFLSGQKNQSGSANLPKYDLQTETKMKGTVEDIKIPPKGSEKHPVHLLVKIGDDTVDVFLCPKSFLDDMGMDFAKGDELTITGSKIKQGDADVVLARQVVKGNNTFVLRDGKGNPVWI